MLRFTLAVLLLSLETCWAWCQKPTESKTGEVCSFSEVYRRDGWTVPGLKGAEAKDHRAPLANIPGVFVTMLQPVQPETYIQDIGCARDNPGRVEFEEMPIKILALWSFDFGGHVFAYRVHYGRQVLEDGVRHDLAAASAVFFYDIDGSGHFSVMKGSNGGVGWMVPNSIPDWVKSKAEKMPTH